MIIKNEKTKKTLDIVFLVYAFLVLLYQITHLIAPILVFVGTHFSWLSQGLAILGVLLLGVDLIVSRNFFDKKYGLALIVLLVIMCVSSIVNIEHGGIIENAKVIMWQAVQMLVLFPLAKRFTSEQLLKYFKIFYVIISLIWSVAIIVSFYQHLNLMSYSIDTDGYSIRQGFSEGRLFGIFHSVYFASTFSWLSTIASVFLLIKTKRVITRVWTIIQIVLNFVYIILSGTRSIVVAILVGLFVVGFIYLFVFFKEKNKSRVVKNGMASLLIAALLCGAFFGVYMASDYGLKYTPNLYSKLTGKNIYEDEKELVLERPDVNAENVSNNRFEIWTDYLVATSRDSKSILLGNSPGNYMQVIKDEEPYFYIVSHIRTNYEDMYKQNLIYDTHSAFVSVYVSVGIIGSLVFFFFIAMLFADSLKYGFGEKRREWEFYALLMAIIAILVAGALDSDLFFRCTDTSMIFWIFAGVLVFKHLLHSKEAESGTEKKSKNNQKNIDNT